MLDNLTEVKKIPSLYSSDYDHKSIEEADRRRFKHAKCKAPRVFLEDLARFLPFS